MSDDRIPLFNDFTLDLARGSLTQAGRPLHLRPQTYEVLRYLAENRGRLISKDKLIAEVWQGRAVTDGALGKCIEELREVFGADAREYLRNVRGRGYILDSNQVEASQTLSTHSEQIDVLRVVVEDEEESTDPQSNPVDGGAARSGIPRAYGWKKPVAITVLTLTIVAAAAGLSYRSFVGRQPTSPRIESIAVLPLKNESGNNDVDYLSEGVTESLINTLSRLPNLSVKPRTAVVRYKGKDIDPQRTASELSVQAILTGRFVQRGDELTLYLSLVDAKTGNQVWGEQYDRKTTELAALQRETALDVSEKLRSKLKPEDEQRLISGMTQNSDAYRAYLKGRYYWNNPRLGGYQKSIEYFQQAIDLDPAYALGYAGLAHYYGFAAASGRLPPDENWQRSESAIKKALAIDDALAESYNALSGVQLYYYHDWSGAERSFLHGIQLNPNSAEVRHHYSRCLQLFGRNDESVAQMQRTLEIEPLSLAYSLNAGKMFYMLRQYDRAIDQLNKTLELEPAFPAAHDWLGYIYEKMGKEQEAVAEWQKVMTLTGASERAALLNRTFKSSGFPAVVRLLAQQRLQELTESTKRGEYVAAIEYVTVYTRMGDKEKALQWLDKATQERNRFAFEFKINPLYDSLRDDPRFQEFADRVKAN